jgi:hypothetical protein
MADPVHGQPNGLDISAGSHMCAISTGRDERDALLVQFIGDGLDAGDKCLFGLHDRDPWEVMGACGTPGKVDRSRARHQLEVLGGDDARFSPDEFSIGGMLAFWDGVLRESIAGGFDFARLCAEATWWAPQMPGDDSLIDYEAELTDFVAGRQVAILCMYDLSACADGTLIGLMRTHPRVLINGQWFENPYFS